MSWSNICNGYEYQLTMKENNKRLFKNSIIMYIRVILSVLIGLIMTRVILDVLGASDYGTYNVVGGFVSSMVIISNPMMTGAQRFFAYDLGKRDFEQLKIDFNTTNLIYWGLALLIFIFLETAGLWFVNNKMVFEEGRMDIVNWVYQLSVFAFLLQVLAIPYNSLLLAHENIMVGSVLAISEKILQLILILFLYIVPYDRLLLYSIFMFVVAVIMRLIPQFYCKKKYKETDFHFYWDKRYVKSIAAYSGYNSIGVLAIVFMNQGLSILLNTFFGPIVNAANAVCSRICGIVETFTMNIYTPTRPQIAKYYASEEFDYMWVLVARVCKIMYFISMIITIPLCIEIDYILHLWLGEYPDFTNIFVRLLLIANLISCNGTLLCGVLQAANKIKNQQLTVAVINLLNLPLSYFALKLGSGPYIPFAIMIVMNLFSLIVSIRVTGHDTGKNMKFYYNMVVNLFIVTILSAVPPIIYYMTNEENFSRLLLVTIISILSSTFFIYFVGLNSSEKKYVVMFIDRIAKRYLH